LRRFLAIASLLGLVASAARAANIVVDTTADGVVGSPCDIRDAITAAENDAVVGGCLEVTPNGADVVDLRGLTGTIHLQADLGPLPTMHTNVTLLGPGANLLAIDAADLSQILVIGSTGFVTVQGLTISNGSAAGTDRGGCIDVVGGALILQDSRITGCEGFNGGGIAVDQGGAARLDRVLVDGNNAGNSGGGLVNGESTVAITDSTFSGNVSAQAGGGVATFGHDGGGVATETRIASSTFADNGGPDGANVFNSTDGDPLVHTFLTHALIANPRASAPNCGGAETSQGWNLATDATCGLDALTDHPSAAAGIEAALAGNGGATFTHALTPGSVAIDGGNPLGCTDTVGVPLTIDQRGAARPTDGNGDHVFECDIGAFEAAPEPGAGAAAVAVVALACMRRSRRRRSLD
jgi:hypothetical protein